MVRGEEVRLEDGGTVIVRPIRRTDAEGILGLHARMSERTRYLRFFSAYPRIPDRDLQRFVTVDHRDREALVAVHLGDLIAVARYDRLPGSTDAEVAFVVDDAHQRRGLAPILLRRLADRAREAGIETFTAEVLPANRPMMSVFGRSGFRVSHRYADGVIHVSFPIAPGPQANEDAGHE
jgi:GNAT superfamily N-acetyltransferase